MIIIMTECGLRRTNSLFGRINTHYDARANDDICKNDVEPEMRPLQNRSCSFYGRPKPTETRAKWLFWRDELIFVVGDTSSALLKGIDYRALPSLV